ncbi:MAG: hypothetical protein IJ445_02775 [Clostridia bacterium]|nr:hypothetical protein [Clostridia bacterium]
MAVFSVTTNNNSAFCDEGRVTFYLFYYGCLASYTSSVCSASTFPSR